jgi:hypothetical protein
MERQLYHHRLPRTTLLMRRIMLHIRRRLARSQPPGAASYDAPNRVAFFFPGLEDGSHPRVSTLTAQALSAPTTQKYLRPYFLLPNVSFISVC